MLELLNLFTGHPTTGLQHLVLPRETLLLYPSLDSIIIRNARTLSFVRALVFWEAFPGAVHANEAIQCLSVDPGMKLIVASMGTRLATWAMSGVRGQSDAWRVHSSLLLPDARQVTTIDCKSGLLAVGNGSTLSIYTLVLDNDLPTWSLKWNMPIMGLTRVRFSPSLMYIASTSTLDNAVRIFLTTSGKQTQRIRHPRPITDMNWRRSQASSRDDLILYTITADATLRIYLPILDTPQHVQLHASLDLFQAVPFSEASQQASSKIFWLDREVVCGGLIAVLGEKTAHSEDGRHRRVQEIMEEGWDLFLRILADGSLVLQAVANIDRRPPTLLKQFTLLQSSPDTLPPGPRHLYVVPSPATSSLTLLTSPPISSYDFDPLPFFDAQKNGLRLLKKSDEEKQEGAPTLRPRVSGFVRTPNGEGLGVLSEEGGIELWEISLGGRTAVFRSRFRLPTPVEHMVVLEGGRDFVAYSAISRTLSLYSPQATEPLSLSVPTIISMVTIPSEPHKSIVMCLTEAHSILLVEVALPPLTATPLIQLHSESSLPIDGLLKALIPVDPMAWSGTLAARQSWETRDVLVSLKNDGELAFWSPGSLGSRTTWRCTGSVQTSRTNVRMSGCSSAKKTVLVCESSEGQEMTIWNSTTSEFASGQEYVQIFSSADPIVDLDWTATPDNQSILAVGFAHHVDLLCQQRMTYFDDTPGWAICHKIDLSNTIPHPISDSIWLRGGSLMIGAGHLMSLYGVPPPKDGCETESLFEHVARYNGPLDEYHPQMLLQCLLWEKVELVKNIVVNLAKNLAKTRDIHTWQPLAIEEFFKKDDVARVSRYNPRTRYNKLLFSDAPREDDSDGELFSRHLIENLITKLEEQPLPHLTPNEHEYLLVLIQATLEIEEQRRALDSNGLRYITAMRVFYIYNRRLSSMTTPDSASTHGTSTNRTKRARLRYRDMLWAFHSESQDLLLSAATAASEGGRMVWADARSMGVSIWLNSVDTMKTLMETIARNQYMSGDNRDPTQCSLLYFALGKVKLVHGLWRQAAWHKEQTLMLKFLNNDFTQPRWRTAALKNAFALLSKRRFEYAAAFFLLGGSLKDAVNVCIRNLDDFQLAIALARVGEQGDDGPILQNIISSTVIPTAFRDGNRYLASWAFWKLHRRDLAVRILVTPLSTIATLWNGIQEIAESRYDDPSLALLFSQLKSKTLQTAKGTSEISGRTEFSFVLQIARVFCRMGCHVLALDLVRTWSFERPSTVVHDSPALRRPPSPLTTRFALEPALRRQSSIMIDMDIPTNPPTRSASPTRRHMNGLLESQEGETLKQDDGDLVARKAGMGRLMKSAKQDVQVPEFDMGAFF